jgi:hypothetical protein
MASDVKMGNSKAQNNVTMGPTLNLMAVLKAVKSKQDGNVVLINQVNAARSTV